VTLKTKLGVRQGHWKCHHAIEQTHTSAQLIFNLVMVKDSAWYNNFTKDDVGLTAAIEHFFLKATVLNVFFSLHHSNCLYLMNTKWYLL